MNRIIVCLIILSSFVQLHAQKDTVTLNLTLDQAIEIAKKQSIFSFRQKNMYLSRYWDFRSYKASKLPSLSLSSDPIQYSNGVRQWFNGSVDTLVYRESLTSSVGVDVSQNVTLTGGKISAGSDFVRIENYKVSDEAFPISYNPQPFSIRISQPLNGYNSFRWDAKIEPLKFEQAKREYLQSLQELARRTTNVFFNLIKAEINLSIAKTNLSNADTLYRIGKGRFEIGTVTQDELLDLELGSLNANMELNRTKLNLQQAKSAINSFLGFDDNVNLECVVPADIPTFKVMVDDAMAMAFENNPQMLNFKEQLLNAERQIAQARAENGFNANVTADIGISKSTYFLEDVYKSPFGNNQNLSVSLGVPIIDWGLRKGKVQMARSNQQVTEATVKQAEIDFEQNIFIQVMEFNMQEEQVKIAAKADTIAQLGYDVTKQRFLIDKVDVIKLNAARTSLESAKRGYIQSIQDFWVNYYNIRELTLYDFEKQTTLIEELDHLLQR